MTGWSEDFEQRLQTVIQSGPGLNANAFPSPVCRLDDILDLDPESTVQSTQYYRADAAAQRPVAPSDPTSAFFESIRTQGHPDRSSSSGSRSASYYAVGGSGGSGGRGQQALQHSNLSSARGLFTPTAQMIRASSPPVDVFERPGVQELEESYSSRAAALHSEATDRMTAVSDRLETELVHMAARDDAFLSTVVDRQFRFSQPAEAWMVKVQTRESHDGAVGGGPVGGGGPVEKEERIVDRIAAIRAAAATLEGDLERLWAEWGKAHAEATGALAAMTASGGGEDDEEFHQIIAKAEKELNAASAEAIKEMHDNEKTFKRVILAEECKLAQMMLSRQSKYD